MDERNENFQGDSIDVDQFFGRVPKPLELAFVGACLGAPIQYKKEKATGLDQVCMLVPNKRGFQPIMVTFGKEDSVGNGAFEAIYHQVGLEKILNLTKRS